MNDDEQNGIGKENMTCSASHGYDDGYAQGFAMARVAALDCVRKVWPKHISLGNDDDICAGSTCQAISDKIRALEPTKKNKSDE